MYNYSMSTDFNYKDYVTFGLPPDALEKAKQQGIDVSPLELDAETRAKMEKTFEELSQTPEGRQLIMDAAKQSPSDTISIVRNAGPNGTSGETGTRVDKGLIYIGDNDNTFRYYSDKTGQYHDMSIQNLMVHELNHIAYYINPDDESQENFEANESDAIRRTNEYMAKYYGEPPRSEDPNKGDKFGGSNGWDVNEGFNPSGYDTKVEPEKLRKALLETDQEQVAMMSPEIQSLHAYKDHENLFKEQFAQLESSGGMEYVAQDIQDFGLGAPKIQAPAAPAQSFAMRAPSMSMG